MNYDQQRMCEECGSEPYQSNCTWCRASLCDLCLDAHGIEHEEDEEQREWEREGRSRGWA